MKQSKYDLNIWQYNPEIDKWVKAKRVNGKIELEYRNNPPKEQIENDFFKDVGIDPIDPKNSKRKLILSSLVNEIGKDFYKLDQDHQERIKINYEEYIRLAEKADLGDELAIETFDTIKKEPIILLENPTSSKERRVNRSIEILEKQGKDPNTDYYIKWQLIKIHELPGIKFYEKKAGIS